MWLTLIFSIAFGVRLLNIALSSAGAGEIHDDAVDYHMYALNMLDHATYVDGGGHRASRLPGYPLFLAGVYALLGHSVLKVQLVQSVLNSFACVLLYFVARAFLAD